LWSDAEGCCAGQPASLPRLGALPSSYPQQVVAFLLQAIVVELRDSKTF